MFSDCVLQKSGQLSGFNIEPLKSQLTFRAIST